MLSEIDPMVSEPVAGLEAEGNRRTGHRRKTMHALLKRLGECLTAGSDLAETLSLLAGQAVDLLDADEAAIQLLDHRRQELAMVASCGSNAADLEWLQVDGGEKLPRWVFERRHPLVIADLLHDPRTEDLVRQKGIGLRSLLVAPLQLKNRIIGILTVGWNSPVDLAGTEIDISAFLAAQAAVAVRNSRLLDSLQARLEEMSGLYEISLALGSLTKLEDVYGQLVERISSLLHAERCVILLLDEDARHLVAQAPAFGMSEEEVAGLRLSLTDDCASTRVFFSGQAYLTNDAQHDPRNIHRFVGVFGEHSLLIVPLRVGDRTIGLIRASGVAGHSFTTNDLRLLTIFAAQAAMIVQDALSYREVASQRERLQAIFDNISDGIMIVDPGRQIVALNPAFEQFTGWRLEEVVGRHCWEVLQPHDEKGNSLCQTECPVLASMKNCESVPYIETIICTKFGPDKDVAASYSYLPDGTGRPVYGVAIVRDISKAKEVDRLKSQFISLVSHELRTPLASVRASIGVVLASMPSSTNSAITRLLQNIDRSSERLDAIVSDLLDLTRLQSGRVQLNLFRIDLKKAVLDAAGTIKPLTDGKGQRLRLMLPEEPVELTGDKQRLEQVALNLLSNAHKYSPSGGTITLTVRTAPNEVVVSVADTGFGIAEAEREAVFERFYRADNGDTRRNLGTGLGLPIAKALIELHGGRIWLESEPGHGSTFSFSLPRGIDNEDSSS